MKTTNDLHNNVKAQVCLASVNLGTASKIGLPIDIRDYGGVEFIINYGAVAASTTTVLATVMESDTATAADFTSVADADLLGTEAAASLAGGLALATGVTSAVVKRIGYKGRKRYAKVKLKASASTVGGVSAVLFNPKLSSSREEIS